jgi:DNA end-binding protein Ku
MARAIWSGVISFGLVTIPVRLVSAVRQKEVHFRQLHGPDGGRIQYRRFCEKEDREVSFQDIVKGYEIARDEYVVITDEEIERLAPERTRRIDLDRFVDLGEIDPVYYDATYYLAPDEQGERPYRLLQEAMSQSRRVAIGKFVMRDKEHVVAIRPLDGALALQTLFYADEVVETEKVVGVVKPADLDPRELRMAQSLIESLEDSFQPEQYHDEFREKVQQLAEQKAKGKEVVLAEEPARPAPVVDLMEALQASVEQARSRHAAAGAGEAPATRQGRPRARERRKKSA